MKKKVENRIKEMSQQSFTIYKQPNKFVNNFQSKRLSESLSSTSNYANPMNAFASDASFINDNEIVFRDLYTKLESIRDEENSQDEEEPKTAGAPVVLFRDRFLKYNFPFVFSEQYFLKIAPSNQIIKYLVNQEGVFVYNKNFERFTSYPVQISSGNHLEVESITVSFLPEKNTDARFLICVFSTNMSSLKVTQHVKAIVSCKPEEVYGETFSSVKNRQIAEGEHRFFIGVMSKNRVEGLLNVAIHNNLQKTRINLTRKHIGKLF